MKAPFGILSVLVVSGFLALQSEAQLITSYSDNFNRASLGTNYTSVASNTWAIASSSYLQEAGSGNGLLFYNLGTLPTAAEFASGYSFTASMDIFIGATAPKTLGMALNYQDVGGALTSYYDVRFRGSNTNGLNESMQLDGRDSSGAASTTLNGPSTFNVSLSTWYTLTVSATTAFTYNYSLAPVGGGTPLISGTFVQNGTQYSGGYIGFYTDNASGNLYDNFSVVVTSPVPEPASVAMLISCGLIFGFVMWRRKAKGVCGV